MSVYVHCNFRSKAIAMPVDVSVLLPDSFLEGDKNKKYQTLYLLHGFCGDHLSWMRGSNIARYAQEKELMVVMPSAYNSAYTDMKYGLDYFSYISRDLPDFIERLFPASEKREDRFVAGMSMGGYGAYKLGLAFPEKFAAVGGIAGSYHAEYRYQGKVTTISTLCEGLYGDPPAMTPEIHDIFTMLGNLKKDGRQIPRLYTCCGFEDRRYQDSVDLKQFADSIGVPLTFEDGHGQHNEEYFDKSVRRVLEWMELKGTAV
ncbi:MAG: alpha/beta hydrolase-fold protein [Eubacteriales bacterium]|nr:alpha/beta hydrolase-fold protein [Eubacteriales bacterium]